MDITHKVVGNRSLLILASWQKSTKSFEVNSPPLSNLKILICIPVCFSTRALKSFNM